jgi:hypothetical protein
MPPGAVDAGNRFDRKDCLSQPAESKKQDLPRLLLERWGWGPSGSCRRGPCTREAMDARDRLDRNSRSRGHGPLLLGLADPAEVTDRFL